MLSSCSANCSATEQQQEQQRHAQDIGVTCEQQSACARRWSRPSLASRIHLCLPRQVVRQVPLVLAEGRVLDVVEDLHDAALQGRELAGAREHALVQRGIQAVAGRTTRSGSGGCSSDGGCRIGGSGAIPAGSNAGSGPSGCRGSGPGGRPSRARVARRRTRPWDSRNRARAAGGACSCIVRCRCLSSNSSLGLHAASTCRTCGARHGRRGLERRADDAKKSVVSRLRAKGTGRRGARAASSSDSASYRKCTVASAVRCTRVCGILRSAREAASVRSCEKSAKSTPSALAGTCSPCW